MDIQIQDPLSTDPKRAGTALPVETPPPFDPAQAATEVPTETPPPPPAAPNTEQAPAFDDAKPSQDVSAPPPFDPEKPSADKPRDDQYGTTKPFNGGPIKTRAKGMHSFILQTMFFGLPGAEPKKAEGPPKVVKSDHENFVDYLIGMGGALEAGWKQGVLSLTKKQPDVYLSEDADMYYRIASQIGQTAGDLPYMLAGGVAGGAVTAEGGPVAAVGAGAGGFALPTALRQMYMDYYEKGEVKDFKDFWERFAAITIETTKSAVVGGATGGAGQVAKSTIAPAVLGGTVKTVSKVAGPAAGKIVADSAGNFIGGTAKTMTEIATMVTVGHALNGTVPKPQEFLEAAVVIGGMHASGLVATKLRRMYSETGLKPAEIALEAEKNPILKQEILSEDGVIRFDGENYPVKGELPNKIVYEGMEIDVSPQPETPAEKSAPARSEAFKKVASQIGTPADTKAEGINPEPKFNEFYRQYFDRFNPVDEAVKQSGVDVKSLADNENPYQLTRMVNDWPAKMEHFALKGTLEFGSLKQNGESFNEATKGFKGDREAADVFLKSLRDIEKYDQGKTKGVDIDAAREVVKEFKSKFGETAKKLTEWNNRVNSYYVESGMASKRDQAIMETLNKHYVPYSRIMEDNMPGSSISQKKAGSMNIFRGSEKNIESPIQASLDEAETKIALAERNRAVKALADQVFAQEGQTLFEKVDMNTRKIEVSKEEVAAQFKKLGIEADPQAMEFYRRYQKPVLAENEFHYFEDGKMKIVRAPKPVAEAIKSLDGNPVAQSMFVRLAATATAALKAGTTLSPEFIIKNMWRDQLHAGVLSKHGMIPFTEMVSGWATMFRGKVKGDLNEKAYWNWLKSGGAGGSFIDLESTYGKHLEVFELERQTGFINGARNAIKAPIDFIKVAGHIIENGPRLAEFNRASGGASEGAPIFKGGFASREVTLDFTKMGAKLSATSLLSNATTAFQNVAIQGADRTFQAIKANPDAVINAGVKYIAMPSALLWFVNHDDPRYKKLPRNEKDLNWHIFVDRWKPVTDERQALGRPSYLVRKTKDGKWEVNDYLVVKVPKPQELGLMFGATTERMLELYVAQNPRAMKDFEDTMIDIVTPSFMPDIIRPGFEQAMNKNMHTSMPLVSYSAEQLLPQDQSNDYTSETAKALGTMIAKVPILRDLGPKDTKLASPPVVENYIRAWSGTLGGYSMQIIDQALIKSGLSIDKKSAWTVNDVPFVKAFLYRNPTMRTQNIIDFRDKYEANSKIVNSIKAAYESGNVARAEELRNLYGDSITTLQGTKEAIANLGAMIHKVNDMPLKKKEGDTGFTRDEKRWLINGYYYLMDQAAEQGVKLFDQLEKKTKETLPMQVKRVR